MAEEHCSSDHRQATSSEKSAQRSAHERAAGRLPLFLRAWWLRDYDEASDLVWPEPVPVTGAIWSTHSDPLCDANFDYREDI